MTGRVNTPTLIKTMREIADEIERNEHVETEARDFLNAGAARLEEFYSEYIDIVRNGAGRDQD